LSRNNLQTFREGLLMSKAELARKAGLSTLTIDRVEAGRPCRLDTKRKLLLALGLKVSDKDRIFIARSAGPYEERRGVREGVYSLEGSPDAPALPKPRAAISRDFRQEKKGEATR
jgi:DNA-binding XRE family transcriptional regulator